MPQAIVKGSKGPIFQGNIFTWDPRAGLQNGSQYKGVTDVMLPESGKLQLDSVAHSLNESKGITTITLTGGSSSGGSDGPVDNWQLLGNELQKSWAEHPNSLALEVKKIGTLGVLSQDAQIFKDGKGLIGVISNGNVAYPAASSGTGYLPFNFDSATYNQAMQLFKLLISNSDHYSKGQPVLRHTQTVGDSYLGDLPQANEEKIYTTQQLLDECAGYPRKLPLRLVNRIKNFPAPDDVTGYRWGWRKLPINEITVGNFKIEITTEWYLDLWSTFYYQTV